MLVLMTIVSFLDDGVPTGPNAKPTHEVRFRDNERLMRAWHKRHVVKMHKIPWLYTVERVAPVVSTAHWSRSKAHARRKIPRQ